MVYFPCFQISFIYILGDRLTVGPEPLKLLILVRFQVSQPRNRSLVVSARQDLAETSWKINYIY